MFENKKIQIRISEELLNYCKAHNENVSLFIREAIREKIESGLLSDTSLNFVEVRARTPYTYLAKMDRVVDGDTILLDVDLGFFITYKVMIRLMGIDCPPIDKPEGKKALKFLTDELTGSNLLIEAHKKEKYGRFLAYVYYSKEHSTFEGLIRYGKLINEELIKGGFANKYKDD